MLPNIIQVTDNGNLKDVEYQISIGADIDAVDRSSKTALMYASINGNYEIAKVLLSNGAKVDAMDRDGITALMYASDNGHDQIAGYLKERGAKVNATDENNKTALMYASESGHDKVAKTLINAGADVDLEYAGKTALMYASEKGHDGVAKTLIDNRANVNFFRRNESDFTALMYASYYGHDKVAKTLINAGAIVDLEDANHKTALMYASKEGHDRVAKTLIDNGRADVNASDVYGDTALILAFENGHDEVAKTLINAGAIVDLEDADHKTALIHASYYGHDKVAKTLIDLGADVNLVIKEGFYVGKTAIEAVATNPNINENKKQEIFSKLYEMGAILRPEFFDNDAISDNMKDFAREHNTPEKIAERDKNLQDIFKKSILLGQPITFRDNVVDKVLLNALKSIDLDEAGKENVIKLRRSGVYSLLKIEEHLNDKEFSLSAKNLKDFKAISDKAPFVRSSNKLDEDMMSKILMHSLMPNSLGKDLTLKIINQIKILTAPANRPDSPRTSVSPPTSSDRLSPDAPQRGKD